jgi:hypothetical protein
MSDPGFIYVLDTGVGMKIGKTSRSLAKRMKELSPTFRLTFVHAIYHRDVSNLERALHAKFRDKRISGLPSREVFALTLNDLAWIQSIVNHAGCPCIHFDSLTDAVRHSIAMQRRYFARGRR